MLLSNVSQPPERNNAKTPLQEQTEGRRQRKKGFGIVVKRKGWEISTWCKTKHSWSSMIGPQCASWPCTIPAIEKNEAVGAEYAKYCSRTSSFVKYAKKRKQTQAAPLRRLNGLLHVRFSPSCKSACSLPTCCTHLHETVSACLCRSKYLRLEPMRKGRDGVGVAGNTLEEESKDDALNAQKPST